MTTTTSPPPQETVSKAAANGTLTSSNAAPNFGQSITLTDTLPSTNGLVPTGTVTFYNGTMVIGTGTVNASGIATLTTGALPAGTDSVSAVYSGDGNFSSTPSNTVVETVGKTTPTAVLTTSKNSPNLGQTVTLTDTLSVVNAAAPTGAVTFYNGSTVIGTGTVNSSGVATLSTNSLPVGTDTVTAVYAGDATYNTATSNPITENVTKAAETGTLSTSNAAPSLGQSVTFTYTLPTVNGIVPTGMVTFYNGTTAIGTGSVNGSGIATLTTGALPVGTDTVTAVYSGDNDYNSTTSNPIAMTVSKDSGVAVLTTSNATPSAGQSVTLTDTLPVANGISPTGTVVFYSGSTALGTGTINSSGVATLATTALPVGTDSVTAVYGGDGNYGNGTSNAVTQIVTKGTATGVLITSNAAPSVGRSVTLTDTLPTVEGVIPTGTVTFCNGTAALGTGTVNSSGVATLATTALPVGVDTVAAVYGGDGNYSNSTSNAVTETVAQDVAAVVLSASTMSTTSGQSVTFTATVTSVNGLAPMGSVTFYSGANAIGTGTVNANGVATLTTTALPVGADPVKVVYGGDTNYGTGTSNTVTVTVTAPQPTLNLISSPSPQLFGQPVTLTATLGGTNTTTFSGTITFFDGTVLLGTVNVTSGGVAAFTTGTLPTGNQQLSAVYTSADKTVTAISNTVAQTVIDFTIASSTPNITVNPGSAAAFTINLGPVTGINFGDPVILSVTGLPSNYTVTFTPASVTPGGGIVTSQMQVQTPANPLTVAAVYSQAPNNVNSRQNNLRVGAGVVYRLGPR